MDGENQYQLKINQKYHYCFKEKFGGSCGSLASARTVRVSERLKTSSINPKEHFISFISKGGAGAAALWLKHGLRRQSCLYSDELQKASPHSLTREVINTLL